MNIAWLKIAPLNIAPLNILQRFPLALLAVALLSAIPAAAQDENAARENAALVAKRLHATYVALSPSHAPDAESPAPGAVLLAQCVDAYAAARSADTALLCVRAQGVLFEQLAKTRNQRPIKHGLAVIDAIARSWRALESAPPTPTGGTPGSEPRDTALKTALEKTAPHLERVDKTLELMKRRADFEPHVATLRQVLTALQAPDASDALTMLWLWGALSQARAADPNAPAIRGAVDAYTVAARAAAAWHASAPQ